VTRYVPDGDEPYVLRQRWWHVLVALPPILLGCAAIGWFGIVMQLGYVTLLAALGCLVTLWEGIHQAAAGDRTGIEFAIDERGTYFGDTPFERIPWPQVKEVRLM
jgi:hypothetical protein